MSEGDDSAARPLTDAERAEHWPTEDPFELLAAGYRRVPDSPIIPGCWVLDPPP